MQWTSSGFGLLADSCVGLFGVAFRAGAPLLGPLPASCNGTCIEPPPVQSASELKRNMAAANEDLVKSLREDVESAVLLEKSFRGG